ncbi:MAG: winged helix DNA-binding domain-containing protein [Candidatus Dormibacteraeota bacterium]|nr:winged helix DNA-binding domain-containing protein [Candidatus Dormibacteraeota bacterium]
MSFNLPSAVPIPNPGRTVVERFHAQLLAGRRPRDPVAVPARLLAVQAQDLRGAYLAIRSRSFGLSSAQVDRAFTKERSLVVTWLNRGTLHLVRSEDYPWLHGLTTPGIVSANSRRLRQEGVTPDAAKRGVAIIERSLTGDGPLTRPEIGERLRGSGVRVKSAALVHLLLLASLRGLIVRGPMVRGQHAFVLVRDWLDKPKPIDRDRAIAELARRYLAGHGPATERDLAYWSGLPLRDARAGLNAIASEIVERAGGMVSLKGSKSSSELAPPRLLGSFDPVLFGWTSRDPILGADAPAVVSGGLFRPFGIVGGKAVATWTFRAGKVELKPFRMLTATEAAALKADAADVLRFLS